MINFLIYHASAPDDEYGHSAGYYRVQYSSKEKLRDDLTIAVLNAMEKEEYSFEFLGIRMRLSDFNYIGAYYNEFDEPFSSDDISIMTLDEWFNEQKVGVENVDKIHEGLVLSPLDLVNRNNQRLLKIKPAPYFAQNPDVTARLNAALTEMGFEKLSES